MPGAEFVPFLQFDNAIRQVIYTTNAIESVNARIRRGYQGPWTLSDRGRGLEMRVSGHHEPRPERHRPPTLVQPMEGSTECLRDNVRRTGCLPDESS